MLCPTHLIDFGIPHELLHRIFCVEAIAPKDLHSISGHLVGDVPGEGLGDGGVEGVAAAGIHLPGGSLVPQPGQLHLHGHLCQQECHGLVLGEWRPTGRASEGCRGRSLLLRIMEFLGLDKIVMIIKAKPHPGTIVVIIKLCPQVPQEQGLDQSQAFLGINLP